MQLNELIDQIRNQPQQVCFSEVMKVIDEHYDYRPTRFTNGIGSETRVNPTGSNEGSCKIFAFARLHGLEEARTLVCFGDYYRIDVLQHPEGSDHGNIRSFMRHGRAGFHFDRFPLSAKG